MSAPIAAPLQNASASRRGAVSTAAQDFAGPKRFVDGLSVVSGGITRPYRPPLHVADFGAVGDGVTNDAAALQAAINAAGAAKAPLYFDPLVYRVNGGLDSSSADGIVLECRGHANAQQTIIRAGASFDAVFRAASSYLQVSGIQFDANAQANYPLKLDGSSFSAFERCQMRNGLIDGIHLSASGINDQNLFHSCWGYANGQIFCSAGLSSFFSDYRRTTLTGTVHTAQGSLIVTGTGTNFTRAGARVDDFIRIGTGVGGDQFGMIASVDSDTQITLQLRCPATATVSGAAYAIAVGNGYKEVRHNDNNISRFTGHSLWRLNAGAGMLFNGLYGPKVDGPQIDLNGFYGAVVGSCVGGNLTYDATFLSPYFEGNLAAPMFFGSATGCSVIQPVYDSGSPLFQIGAAFENFGVVATRTGLIPIGNAASSIPASAGASPSFALGGTLVHSVSNPGTPTPSTTIPIFTSHVAIPVIGNTLMTSTPTLAAGVLGQEVTLYNQTGDSITLQDEGTLPGSKLRLSASTVTLHLGDSLQLIWTTAGKWVQVGKTVLA